MAPEGPSETPEEAVAPGEKEKSTEDDASDAGDGEGTSEPKAEDSAGEDPVASEPVVESTTSEEAVVTPETTKSKIERFLSDKSDIDRTKIDKALSNLAEKGPTSKFATWVRDSNTAKFFGGVLFSSTVGYAIKTALRHSGFGGWALAGVGGATVGLARGLWKERQAIKERSAYGTLIKELKKMEMDGSDEILADLTGRRKEIGVRLRKSLVKSTLYGGLYGLAGATVSHLISAFNAAPDLSHHQVAGEGGSAHGGVAPAEGGAPGTPAGPGAVGGVAPAPGSSGSAMPFSEYWQQHAQESALHTSQEHIGNIHSYVLEGGGGDIPLDGQHMNDLATAATEGKGWHGLIDAIKENATSHSQESTRAIWSNLNAHDIDPNFQVQGKSIIEYVQELGPKAGESEVSKGLYHFLSHANQIDQIDPSKIDFNHMNSEEFANQMTEYQHQPETFLQQFNSTPGQDGEFNEMGPRNPNLDHAPNADSSDPSPDGQVVPADGSGFWESAKAIAGNTGKDAIGNLEAGKDLDFGKEAGKWGTKWLLLLGIVGTSAGVLFGRDIIAKMRAPKTPPAGDSSGGDTPGGSGGGEGGSGDGPGGGGGEKGPGGAGAEVYAFTEAVGKAYSEEAYDKVAGKNELIGTKVDELPEGGEYKPVEDGDLEAGALIRIGDRVLDASKIKFTRKDGKLTITYTDGPLTENILFDPIAKPIEFGVYELKSAKEDTGGETEKKEKKEPTPEKPERIGVNQIWRIDGKRYLVENVGRSTGLDPVVYPILVELDIKDKIIETSRLRPSGKTEDLIEGWTYEGTLK